LGACALLPDKDKTPQAAEKVGEPQARPQASIEAKQLAAEQEAEVVAEVVFPRGKAGLSAGERARLQKIERKLGDKKKVDRLLVAAWADKALPGDEGKELPDRARKLAEERGKAVREFLAKNGAEGVDMDFHNMAEKPGAVSKFIGAEDARVKKSLEGARPSKAIVLLIKKEN
jgi:outer membrane protein OmpA-like peptidoglycan-associated protein